MEDRQDDARADLQTGQRVDPLSRHVRSQPGFALGRVYVQGLLSDLPRKNAEAIALEFDTLPRTLQRFLESIKWNEKGTREWIIP